MAHRWYLPDTKRSVGLVGLMLVSAVGCDQTNTTYDATYVVRSEAGVTVSEGSGYGTLGSTLTFGQGNESVSLRSQKHSRHSASFEATFADGTTRTVVVPYGGTDELTSKNGRVMLQVRVDSP